MGKSASTSRKKKSLNAEVEEEKRKGFVSTGAFSSKGSKHVNQDRVIRVSRNLSIYSSGTPRKKKKTKLTILGVCDGHGEHGHDVADFVTKHLPTVVFDLFQNSFRQGLNSVETVLQVAVSDICRLVQKSEVDADLSGCTLVFCVVFEGFIYTCHLGDSRAVLGKNLGRKRVLAQQLSDDHLPEVDRHRIEANGGTVTVDEKGNTFLCVHVRRQYSLSIETSRAVGDDFLTSFGLCNDPDISKHELDDCDSFVILASDGLFSVFPNQKVVEFAFNQIKRKKCNVNSVCKQLVQMAREEWRNTEDRVDDISVVIGVLDEKLVGDLECGGAELPEEGQFDVGGAPLHTFQHSLLFSEQEEPSMHALDHPYANFDPDLEYYDGVNSGCDDFSITIDHTPSSDSLIDYSHAVE